MIKLSQRILVKNLAFSLIISFFASSCIQSNNTVGEELVPPSYIFKLDTISFELDVRTNVPDSVQSISETKALIGYLVDPLFGTTTSSSVLNIVPPSNLDLGDDPKLLDVRLRLLITPTNYSDEYEGIAQNIYVHKLKNIIDTTKNFNSPISKDDYESNPLSLGSPIYYGGDTVGIDLPNEYGEELLRTTTEEIEDIDKFSERIKGLYIRTDEPNISKGGRMNSIPLYDERGSAIVVNYLHTDLEEGFENYDTNAVFIVGYESVLNITKTTVDGLKTDEAQEKIYMGGYDGSKPYINAATLKSKLDEWVKTLGVRNDQIIISSAVASLYYDTPADYNEINNWFPINIFACQLGDDNFFYPTKDIFSGGDIGLINRSKQVYSSNISSVVQKLIRTDVTEIDKQDDIWFFPITTLSDDYGLTYAQINTQDHKQAKLNGNLATTKRPELSIVFTIVNDN